MNRLRSLLFQNTTTQQTVIKNTVWMFLGEGMSRISRALLVIIAARILGTEGLGVFAYVMALGGTFLFFEDSGVSLYLTRELAKNPERKEVLLGTAILLKTTLLTTALLLFIIFGRFFATLPGSASLIPVMALVLLFDSLREFAFSINRAQQRMEVEAGVKFITNLIVFIGGIVLISIQPSALMLTIGYAIGGGAGLVLILIYALKYLSNPFKNFSRSLLGEIFHAAWPFTILTISSILIFNTDLLFLGKLTSASEVGAYTAAQRLIQMCYIVPALFASITFPVFAKKTTEVGGYTHALEKTFAFLLGILGALIIGVYLWAPRLVSLLFGAEFSASSAIVQVLAFGLIPIFISTTYSNVVFALNKQKSFVLIQLGGVILNIILNALFIPSLGGVGAALASVLSFSAMALATAYKFQTQISRVNMFKYLSLPAVFFAGIIMVGISNALQRIDTPVLIGLPLAALAYGAILIYTHKKTIRELGLTKDLFEGSKNGSE